MRRHTQTVMSLFKNYAGDLISMSETRIRTYLEIMSLFKNYTGDSISMSETPHPNLSGNHESL